MNRCCCCSPHTNRSDEWIQLLKSQMRHTGSPLTITCLFPFLFSSDLVHLLIPLPVTYLLTYPMSAPACTWNCGDDVASQHLFLSDWDSIRRIRSGVEWTCQVNTAKPSDWGIGVILMDDLIIEILLCPLIRERFIWLGSDGSAAADGAGKWTGRNKYWISGFRMKRN